MSVKNVLLPDVIFQESYILVGLVSQNYLTAQRSVLLSFFPAVAAAEGHGC